MKQINKSLAPALQNGLDVLELLADSNKQTGFNDIARHLGVSKATTSRLLTVLRHRGYVVKDEKSGKYRPGPRMSLFSQALPVVEVLRRELPSILDSLMDASANTVLFIFWNGSELQCLDKRTHQGSVPMQDVGHIDRDLTVGPWGWFAYNSLNEEKREEAEKGMLRYPGFKEVFSRWDVYYKKHNFCYDDQVLYKPLRRLGVPVYDKSGNLLGALGIGGNPLTIKNSQVPKLGKILIDHANKLMEKL